MLSAKVVTVGQVPPQPKTAQPECSQVVAKIRETLEALQHQALTNPATAQDARAVAASVALALQPAVFAALQQRRDFQEAVRDIATRYAFHRLLIEGVALGELDGLSRALIRRVFDVIEKRARQVARKRGENPLDVEPDLLLSISKSLARYVPRKPMGGHIQWKLEHYESAVSRAMRQVKHLVTRPEVTEAFVDYVLDAEAPPMLKAQLLQLARGGGLRGMNYAETIHFFARPETVSFVKSFAATIQTAHTLYAEVEYADIPWRGKRQLPRDRRQGYLDMALAELERPTEVWLDRQGDDDDADNASRHECIPDAEAHRQQESWGNLLHREPFEVWLTRQALAARPDDPLWQVGRWLYLEAVAPAAVVERGLADAATVVALQTRVATLHADPEVWQTWLETRMA